MTSRLDAALELADRALVPLNLIPIGVDRITPQMLPLLNLNQQEIDGIVEAVAGGVSNIADIYPLAPLQEGLLFRHLASEAGDVHLIQLLLGFDRRGRLELFLDALREVISRHDILRTAIVFDRLSQPVQVVMREAILPVEEVNLSDTTSDVARALTERYDPHHFRFDIRQAPMMRAFIAHDAANDRWLLLLIAHHLMLDQTSVDVMRHEISQIAGGLRHALSEPKPFRNFVAQARLGIKPREHEAFFRAMLSDIDEGTLPYGLSGVEGDGSGIRESSLVLDASLSRRVRDRAQALGIEPSAVFHLAWALVLGHVSDRTDVVFGTLQSGRMHPGFDPQRTLGMFINTIPMRVKIDAVSVESAALSAQSLLTELARHEHASLALAQRCSGVPAPAPLFSALFNFRHCPPVDVADMDDAWPGVELLFTKERTDYPIALEVDDRVDDFVLTAQADSPVDPAKLSRFMETAVANLTHALESAPLTQLQSITVLPRAEYEQVTAVWNATSAIFDAGTLDTLFQKQVVRTPSAVAVTGPSESLTYDELETRANRLANLLASRGVGLQTVVGVALPRSVSTVVSLLAILKVGAIYLPLDPAYPPDRLAFMIADSGASLVIANSETESLAPPEVPRISVDSVETAPERPAASHTPDDIAYIIYTSGSTGLPKGVAVPHSAAVNLAFARLANDPIAPGDRILAAISVGFDVSIGQLLLPLLNGAAIVIMGDLRSTSARDFWDFLAEFRVTHINSVPSFFESVLDAARNQSTLVRLLLGGEPFSSALARRLRDALPTTQLVNVYGPTEACIDATHYPVTGNETAAFLPIGKPLANYRAYVLNSRLDPVDAGIPGDLYLAGAGLARGYINQPALTAERFVPDPFGASGERLYKTGDRAYWRPDGNLEFIGRSDTQIKIRGHRVELGEIEANLLRQPGVRETAVIVREDVPGDQRLVAYYTADKPLSSDVLRASLAGLLPTHMVPAMYMYLASLPLTVNGKLDRKALQAPVDRSEFDDAAQLVADELQQQLVQMWETLLGVHRVNIRDNFFALGGHSLLAVRLVKEIERRFHVRLPLAVLFEQPTIEALAQALRRDPASLNRSPLVVLNAAGTATPFFFLHGSIRGGGYYCLPMAEHLGADRPVFALRPQGVDGGPIPATIEAIAAESIEVLKSVIQQGPYLLGGFSSGGLVAFEMARQLCASGEFVENVVLIDTLHAGHKLRQTVELVERLGSRVRMSPARVSALGRGISRFWRTIEARVTDIGPSLVRFTEASDKSKLLRSRAAKLRAFFLGRDERAAGEDDTWNTTLQAWERISDSYVPRPYSGRIAVLFAKDEPLSKLYAKRWLGMASPVDIRPVSGTHFTSITEHIRTTSEEIARSL